MRPDAAQYSLVSQAEVVELRAAARRFASDRSAARAFGRSIAAVAALAEPGARIDQIDPARKRLAFAAFGLVGHADPAAPWHGLGAAIGNWDTRFRAWFSGVRAAAEAGEVVFTGDPKSMLQSLYRPPPVAGVFVAAARIGAAAAAGVPPVAWLIDTGRRLNGEPERLGAVARGFGDGGADTDPCVADFSGVLMLGHAVRNALGALASGGRVPPVWDHGRGVLSYHGTPAKRVVVGKATNVVAVLDAFQAAGWPDVVAAPLPADPAVLHDTIKSLNAGLTHLKFGSNGCGTGVRWEPTPAGG